MKDDVLAERIAGAARLQRSRERWERDRRREDRHDRAVKDDELNGVRLQLRDQAASFATKETLFQLERNLEARITAAVRELDTEGTVGYRESEAARHSREETTREILANSQVTNESAASSRRWIIGLAITIVFSIIANAISLTVFVSHFLGK